MDKKLSVDPPIFTRVNTMRNSVGWSNYPLYHLSVTQLELLPKSYLNTINTPAHQYMTDFVMYTALFQLPYTFVNGVFVSYFKLTKRSDPVNV